MSGLLLSGYLFDFLVNHSTGNVDQFNNIFGLYQGLWLFLLFLVVILALRHSLFINLGIFAGLMYNFLPASGLYFYPWDIPATLFFTLAVILFECRQILLMAAATCAGCFFKETVLVCALLVLFAGSVEMVETDSGLCRHRCRVCAGEEILVGPFASQGGRVIHE